MENEHNFDLKGSRLWDNRKRLRSGAEEKAKDLCDECDCSEIRIVVTSTVPKPSFFDLTSEQPNPDEIFIYDCNTRTTTAKQPSRRGRY
jgi:hypothetical protein